MITRALREGITHGRPVEDGVLRYLSPSAMDLADHSVDGGCLRKWWYRYVAGIRDEGDAARAQGTEVHEQIEEYLTTGRDVLGPLARTALHMMPAPGPDLMVEWPLVPVPPEVEARLRAVPPGQHEYVSGGPKAPCARCGVERDGVADSACGGKIAVDPANSLLSIDGIPIVGYVDLADRRCENRGASEITELVDPRGTAQVTDWKTSRDPDRWGKTRDQVLDATPMIAYAEALARDRLTTHVRLSHGQISTGRRQPARKVTGLLSRDEVARRWEQRAPLARRIRRAAALKVAEDVEANTRSCSAFRGCPHRSYCRAGQLGRLEELFEPKKEDSNMASVLDTLKQPPVPAPAAADPFVDACRRFDQAGHGWPPIAGEVAQRKAALTNTPFTPGSGFAGSGALGGLQWVTDVGTFIALAKEVLPDPAPAPAPVAPPQDVAAPQYAAERAAVPAMHPAQVLPPDAPPSQPHLAALPVAPTPQEVASGAPWVAHVQAQSAVIAAAAPPELAKKTRAKKEQPATVDAAPRADAGPAPAGVTLHVDAVPFGTFTDLGAVVDAWARTICEHYPDTNGPACDLRCATSEQLGFGKWKGVLAAFARESARSLAPGAYYLRARGSDLGTVVAEALRGVVAGGSWGV